MLSNLNTRTIWLCTASIIVIAVAIIYQVSATNNISNNNNINKINKQILYEYFDNANLNNINKINKQILYEYFDNANTNHLIRYINFECTCSYFKIEVGRTTKPSIYYEVQSNVSDELGIGVLTKIRGEGLFDKEIMEGIYNLYKLWQTYENLETSIRQQIEININITY